MNFVMKQALGGKIVLFHCCTPECEHMCVCESDGVSASPGAFIFLQNFCPTLWFSGASQFRILTHKFTHHYFTQCDASAEEAVNSSFMSYLSGFCWGRVFFPSTSAAGSLRSWRTWPLGRTECNSL